MEETKRKTKINVVAKEINIYGKISRSAYGILVLLKLNQLVHQQFVSIDNIERDDIPGFIFMLDFINNGGPSVILGFFWVYFVFIIAKTLSFVSILVIKNPKDFLKKISIQCYKVTSLALQTIFIVPIYQISLSILFCPFRGKNGQCSELGGATTWVLSLYMLLSALFFRILNDQILVATDISKKNTCLIFKLHFSVLDTLVELSVTLLSTLHTMGLERQLIIVHFVLSSLAFSRLIEVFVRRDFIDKGLNRLQQIYATVMFSCSLRLIPCCLSSKTDGTFAAFVIDFVLSSVVFYAFARMFEHSYTQKIFSKKFSKIRETQSLYLIREAFLVINRRDKKYLEKRILLEGFLKLHRAELLAENVATQFLSAGKELKKLKRGVTKNYSKDENIEKFMEFLFKKSTEANRHSSDLHITHAVYRFYIFGNTWGALQSLIKARKARTTLSLAQRYAMERIHFDLRRKIHSENCKEKLNVDSFIKYESLYRQLLKKVKKSSDECDEFWRTLDKEDPDPKSLVRNGMNVAKIDKEVKRIYLGIKSERISAKISTLYADYLENILNDSESSQRIFRESYNFLTNQLNLDIVNQNMEKNEFSEALIIVKIERDFSLGEITQSYGEAQKVMGETNEQLMGKRMSDFLPVFFREDHERLVKDFFLSKRTEPSIKNRSVWVLDSEGYLRKIKLIITPRKEPRRDLEFCVIVRAIKEPFLSRTKGVYEILFKEQTGQVVGLTRNCYEDFGISGSIINKHQQVPFFVGSILDKPLEDLIRQDQNEISLEIDTTKLIDKFLITKNLNEVDLGSGMLDGGSMEMSRDDLLNDELMSERRRVAFQSKFKKGGIRAVVSLTPLDTPETRIMSLKFVEVNPNIDSDMMVTKSEATLESISDDQSELKGKNKKLKSEDLAELMETERLVHEEIEKLRKESTPFQATFLRHLIFWIIMVFVVLYIYEFFLKNGYKENLKTAIDYQIAMERRGLLISRTGYLSNKAYLYQNEFDDINGSKDQYLEKISQDLQKLSKQMNKVELKASKGRFFFQNFDKNSSHFTSKDGDSHSHNVYRYISSLSSLISNIKDPEFFTNSKDFSFIKDNYLDSLRISDEHITTIYQKLTENLAESSTSARLIFMITESLSRVVVTIIYFTAVILILDFEQKGFEMLALMKKETLLKFKSKIWRFRNRIKQKMEKEYFSTGIRNTRKFKSNAKMSAKIGKQDVARGIADDRDPEKDKILSRNRTVESSKSASKDQDGRSDGEITIKRKLFVPKGKQNKPNLSQKAKEAEEEASSNIQDLEEFDIDERKERLRMSQSRRKLLIILSVFPVSGYFFVVSFISFNWEKTSIENFSLISSQVNSVGQVPKIVDFGLNFVQRDFGEGKKNYTIPNGEFDRYADIGYASAKKIMQFTDFAFESTEFSHQYELLYKQSLCYSLNQSDIGVECEDYPILEKSLYTVTIYVLESLRKYAYTSLDSKNEYLEVIQSDQFQEIELIQEIQIEGYNVLLDALQTNLDDLHRFFGNIDVTILVTWNILFVGCYYALDFLIVIKIKTFLFEVRRLLMMIPKSVVNNNEGMVEVLLRGKRKRNNRRRRYNVRG